MADEAARLDTANEAVRRWLEAVISRGDRELVDAAVAPTIRIERFGFGTEQGELVEILEGPGPVGALLARTPPNVVTWGLTDEPNPATPAGDGFTARYTLESSGFTGGGEWWFRLSDDGRITFLAHRPDELDKGANEAVAEYLKKQRSEERGRDSS